MNANASHRTMCDILDDMRKCCTTLNFSYLLGLIEEAQYRSSRMEDAIETMGGWDGIGTLLRQRRKLKDEIRGLEAYTENLKSERINKG